MLPTFQMSQMFHAALLKSSQVGSYLWFGAELSSFTSLTSIICFFADVISSEKCPQTLAAVLCVELQSGDGDAGSGEKSNGKPCLRPLRWSTRLPRCASPVRALNSVPGQNLRSQAQLCVVHPAWISEFRRIQSGHKDVNCRYSHEDVVRVNVREFKGKLGLWLFTRTSCLQ